MHQAAVPVHNQTLRFFEAVELDRPDELFELLEKGADKDARDRYGRTALSIAAECGHDICLMTLLHFGADTEASVPCVFDFAKKCTALHIAARCMRACTVACRG